VTADQSGDPVFRGFRERERERERERSFQAVKRWAGFPIC
jgi:hypothetical protein